jgi:MFS superfamily sulfate permease-like transporter
VVGLYATPGALLLYAAVGSSRHLVVGPMSATAALSAAAVAEVATQGGADFAAYPAALAITTGVLAVAAGLLRLGFLNLAALEQVRRPRRDSFLVALVALVAVLVYRLNAPLLFVNAKRLRDGIRAELRDADPAVRVVPLDLSFTPELDLESVDVLASLRHELDGQGVALWLAGVHAEVEDMLARSGLADDIGRHRLYRTVEDAARDASA